MPALEIIAGGATAPSTTATGITMASGDSLTVRNCPPDSKVHLLTAFAKHQTAGNVFIRSPQLHDNVQGILLRSAAADVNPLLWSPKPQHLVPQDTLVVQLTGSATAGDIELASLLIYYENLPGIDGRFITPEELKTKGKDIMSAAVAVTTTTGPNWTGADEINSVTDYFKANKDYALIGYEVSAICNAIGFKCADFGNIRLGGPGNLAKRELTVDWFVKLSERFNLPLIPVFNSANKNNFFVDANQDENAAAVTVTAIFIELE